MDSSQKWHENLPPPSLNENEAKEIHQALESLAKIVEILDIHDARFSSYSTAIARLTEQHLSFSRSLVRLKLMEDQLKQHLDHFQAELQLLNHWNDTLRPGSAELSIELHTTLERRRDAMLKSAKDYHRELGALEDRQPLHVAITLEKLLAQKQSNLNRAEGIKQKCAKLQAFHGIPPNLDLARHELRVARRKQSELILLRERLLRKMAEGVE